MSATVPMQKQMNRYLVGDLYKDITNPQQVHYVFRVELTSACYHFETIPNLFPDFISDLRNGSHIRFIGHAMLQQGQISQFLNYLFEGFDGLIPHIIFEGRKEQAGFYLSSVVKEWI